jgi:fluoride exporter
MLQRYLIVGLGGSLGAVARYWMGGLFPVGDGQFPLGTFIINLTGSFVLGLFLTLISEKYILPVEWRLFFSTGFVGAYTTFSSLTNEVVSLFRQGYWPVGLIYSAASLLGGMVMVWLGFLTARQFAFGSFQLQGETLEQQRLREQADREKAELAGTIPVGSLPTEEHSELDLD